MTINCVLQHRHDLRSCVAHPCGECGDEMDAARVGGARYLDTDNVWRCGACHELYLKGGGDEREQRAA